MDDKRLHIFLETLNRVGVSLDLDEETLLKILNAAIIPNSISPNVFKYSAFSAYIMAESKEKEDRLLDFVSKLKALKTTMKKPETAVCKFFILNEESSLYEGNIAKAFSDYKRKSIHGDPIQTKKITPDFGAFKEFFWLIKKVKERGHKNGRFPRI